MSIWYYDGQPRNKEKFQPLDTCPFCSSNLALFAIKDSVDKKTYSKEDSYMEGTITDSLHLKAHVCQLCGWWWVSKETSTIAITNPLQKSHGSKQAAFATLKELDLADISIPVSEVRDFLIAKYEARYELHPRVFEQTVASVFENLGYQARVTAYSNDGGLDVVLQRESSEVGVQVKRYKNSIQVEQIRSFLGALVLGGLTKGVFVTTSSFQKGANQVVEQVDRLGYSIELLDAPKFFEALKLAQGAMYRSMEEFLTVHPVNNLQFFYYGGFGHLYL